MFDEKEILEFWEKNKVFEKSVSKRKGKKHFVFFEGPPTANNVPHIGHFGGTRVFKDIVLRYKTMRGYYAPRRAGWDTQGLPVEVEVEKALGLKNKKDIESYGVAAFNKKCRESVWKYKENWEKFTMRMGFWIDMAHPYITYENSYIESLWWAIKEFAKKKYLYEDYKVVPWCARCGTTLSSHELAQGYEKIKEESVYIKFRSKGDTRAHFLAWTTTPWTLPGNAALAVGPKVDYIAAKAGGEIFILAEARVSMLSKDFQIIKKFKGSELVGKEYEPLYPDSGKNKSKLYSFKIVAGDFVSTEEGTGIVHIAPAFGDDDFQLSKKNNLPVLETTNERGLMQTPGKQWDGEWFKKADKLIVEDLKSCGLLFKTEPYEHDYPFCWRCKNPLMYLARKAWWVDVNAVRQKLLANNQKINWHPEHIKDGRMGEWLKEKKNWAFSRERYWGTPLPVWRCEACKKWEAVGSVDELKKRGVVSGNKYFIMRHGESESNKKNITNCDLAKNHYPLTAKGRKQVLAAAKLMKKQKIKPDLIFTSPFLRTKETAEIVGEMLGVSLSDIKPDPRLAEINTGVFSEGNPRRYHLFYKSQIEKFEKAPPQGETLNNMKKRVGEAIDEIEARHKNKTVLIATHEYTAWMLWTVCGARTNEVAVAAKENRGDEFLKFAQFEKMDFPALPRGEDLVLDLHKPFIDEVKFKCQCGGEMKRVPEVCDVWFDSGAMPFAQNHYPFEKKLEYPADYISEAIDQTRGLFYSLLAISTILGRGIAYKNVLTTGLILDSKGKKMSKSLGNVVDPMMLIEKYGADAARWYFFTINQPWDSKLFREDDVKDASRRFFMILWNVLQFWKMYAVTHPRKGNNISFSSPSFRVREGARGRVINQWVLVKLSETAGSVTKKLDAYDIVGAARELENFIVEDVSRWYVRRIRDVMKSGSAEFKETSAVLAYLLGEISKLLAPFAPFISEKIWMELGNKNSVHLEDWPDFKKLDEKQKILLKDMEVTRKIVGLALEARAKAGIRVRQPLAKLETKSLTLAIFVRDEVNVKDVIVNTKLPEDVRLDTKITPELKEEGILRDLIREIQAARKTAGLKPKDKVAAQISLPKEILEVAQRREKDLIKETNLKFLQFSESTQIKIILK